MKPIELARPERARLHEGDAFALHGVGDDHLGLAGDGANLIERVREGLEIMAIAAGHMPAEGRELGFQIAEIARFFHPDVGLQLVVIDDHRDGVELVVGR